MMSSFFNPIRTHFGFTLSAVPLPAPPAILRSDGSLAMGSTSTGSPGTEKTFTVEGTNLTGDIVVVGSTNIEVSLTTGAGFGSSVSVSPSGGTVASTTIYTRIKSGATAGAISENIYSTSAGSAGYATLCTGTVTSGPSFPSSGLVAYWSFDDTLTDTVGSKVLTASGGNSYVAGKLGTKALQLTDGSYATVTTDDFDFVANPMSVCFWAKFATGGGVTVSYDNGGDVEWLITINGAIASFAGDQAGKNLSFGVDDVATYADDTWHMVCLRFDASNIYGNVNARTEVSAAGTTLASYAGGDLKILAVGATCAIDGLAIFNECKTDQDVVDLYNSGSGVSP